MTATAVAGLIRQDETGLEVRVVSGYELLHEFGSEDRERILDRLNSRTTADIKRNLELREAAQARIASYVLRSGLERRSGHDRRTRRLSHLSTHAGRERKLRIEILQRLEGAA